jgi:Icc-related predicted phosphoesterase
MASKLKLFFATGLHGSNVCFRKFINAGNFYGADVLVVGGDVTGKATVPMVRTANGGYRVTFGGEAHTLETSEELASFEKLVATPASTACA